MKTLIKIMIALAGVMSVSGFQNVYAENYAPARMCSRCTYPSIASRTPQIFIRTTIVKVMPRIPISTWSIHPVVTLSGGAIEMSNIKNKTYNDPLTEYTDTYFVSSGNSVQAIGGAFVGAELADKLKSGESIAWQFGIGYYQPFSSSIVQGNLQQVQRGPINATFPYNYQIQARQLLFDNKLLFAIASIYHPYISFGIGAGMNTASNYTVDKSASAINYPAVFPGSNTMTSLSYELGLGVDVDLKKILPQAQGLRLGIGYRYVNWGEAGLGGGSRTLILDHVDTIGYQVKQSLMSQELLLQLSYVF